ncbi:MAG: cytochrome d ubiquinol oxidase subunit II [Bacteroidota bacterium]
MIYFVIFCLFASLTLYVLFAGADFGAGILELLTPRSRRSYVASLTTRAIGPVWEANHVWLILVIVILFTGFPSLHTLLANHLHLPILFLLLGIIVRGTAFVFRHYDAVKDGLQRHYRNAFVYSSMLTPLCLGVIAGAGIRGIDIPENPDFHAAYLAPWLNGFSFFVGLFTVSICGYLAAVFIMGEEKSPAERKRYARQATGLLLAMVGSGGLVFATAYREDLAFWGAFTGNAGSIGMVGLATLSVPLMRHWLRQDRYLLARLAAGGQVSLILLAVYTALFPHFVLGGHPASDLLTAAAPDKTINMLGGALIVGLSIIGPSIAYLMWVFKGQKESPDAS